MPVVSSSREQRRVLIIGADGLRPDLLDSHLMPTVVKLATAGVRCWDHHAAYPTHTRVNISTLASGSIPGRHGIIANTMVIPHITDDHIIDTSNYQHINSLERASDGGAIFVPTLGDLLAVRGERVAVAGTSTPGAGMLWTHRYLTRIVNTDSAYGIADLYDLREKLGEIPEREFGAQLARQAYVTEAVIRLYLDDPKNRVIVLWFNEPDSSQHYFGLGAPETVTALQEVDRCVATLLDALDQRGLRDQFDIFFISDHGHSTVRAHNTLRSYLAEAYTEIGYSLPLTTASDYIYLQPGEQRPTRQAIAPLVEWLLAQPWVGVIMSSDPLLARLPGLLSLSSLWNEQSNERAPLLAVSPCWSHALNEHGVPGDVMSLTTQSALRSSHGSASPFDLHALLIANGTSFHQGLNSQIPTGAIDLLPTILTLLGIVPPATIDGRVLWEIMQSPVGEPGEVQRELVEPTVPNRNAAHTSQLAFHRVGNTRYLHGTLQENAFFATPGPRL